VRTPLLCIAILVILCSTLVVQPSVRPLPAPDFAINQLLEPIRVKNKLPSLAAAIVTEKGLVSAGASGVRKLGETVPVTVDDRWHLGSDTKAMTATLIGVLVEHGKLRWDSTIGEIFPDMSRDFPKDFANITILQLLSHHAGLPFNIDWHNLKIKGSLIEQRRIVVQIASTEKRPFRPGIRFYYSNVGYVIAGAMAERVTGTTWETLMTEMVFKPLGMQDVAFGGTGTPGQIDQPWPHTADGKPRNNNGVEVDNPPVMGPASRVNCPLTEWAKFIADQLRGDRGEPALLSPTTYRRLHTPPVIDADYALGWLLVKHRWAGGTAYTHAGSNLMNFALVLMAPQRDFAVLVVTNQGGDDADKGCEEAATALINLYQRPDNTGSFPSFFKKIQKVVPK